MVTWLWQVMRQALPWLCGMKTSRAGISEIRDKTALTELRPVIRVDRLIFTGLVWGAPTYTWPNVGMLFLLFFNECNFDFVVIYEHILK